MGDVWVKGNKFYCELCKMHIHNNAVSRKNHDTSSKHTKAAENQLRNVLKRQDAKTREEAKMSRMLGQIDAAAMKSFKRDQVSGASITIAPQSSSQGKSIPKTASLSLYGYGTVLLISGQGYQEKDTKNYHPSAPIWSPPAHLLERVEADPFAWVPVELPTTEEEQVDQPVESKKVKDDTYDEEDQGGDKLNEFKLVEKTVQEFVPETGEGNDSGQEVLFKKRKFAAKGNLRKIRKNSNK